VLARFLSTPAKEGHLSEHGAVGATVEHPSSAREHHAYLVTTHVPSISLQRLVARLSRTGTIFVHVDKKIDLRPFRSQLPEVCFVRDRVHVIYPNWSLCEASLRLCHAALEDSQIHRLTLLRHDHYPVVPDTILEELGLDVSNDYIRCDPAPDERLGKPESRFTRRASSIRGVGTFGRRLADYAANHLLPPLDYRRALAPLELRAGSAYWSLTAPTVRSVIDLCERNPKIQAYFRLIRSPAESFFQTVVPQLCPPSPSSLVKDSLAYSYWPPGRQVQHPSQLTRDVLLRVMHERRYLFAKKFPLHDVELHDFVDAELQASSPGSLSDVRNAIKNA